MADEASKPGRRYIEALISGTAPPPPYPALLGMRVTAVGEGTATFEMPVTPSLYNPNGVAHGGALASLLDSAMGLAVISTLDAGENFTTVDLTVNFIRAVTAETGTLRSVGTVVHRGRQTVVSEAICTDGGGQLVARATSTGLLFAGAPAQTVTGQPAPAPAPPADSIEAPPAAAAPPPPPPPPPPPATVSSPPLPPPPPPVIPVVFPPVVPAQPPGPLGPPSFAAPPSRLEHERTMTTSPTEAQPPVPSAFAQSKWRVRLFAGEMAFIRVGQGIPVMLLHGIPSSSYLWRDAIGPLAQHFDVVAPDLLGYGDSDKRVDSDLSVAAQERYIIALMESLAIQRAHLVGHDIGGGIAQLIAADEPARVGKLVLIDSVVDTNWPIPDIARLHDPFWDQRMVTADLRQGFGEGLEAGIVTPGRVTSDLLDEWVRPFADQAGRRAYLRAARSLNNKDLTSRSNDIRQIGVPTLIIWGANDKFLDRNWADKLHQKIPGSVVQVIEPGGHFLPIDRPDALVPLLLQFLTTP